MNVYSTLWGYPNESPRGNAMEDFISSTNLHLLNVKYAGPTFQQRNAKGWPDLTLSIGQNLSNTTTWEVLEDVSFNENNFINIQLNIKVQSHSYTRTNNLQASTQNGFTVNKSSEETIVDFIDEIEMARLAKQHGDLTGHKRQVALNTSEGPATLPQHRGCAQSSCSGRAFCNLVANEVLTQSWREGVHLPVFVDDFIFLIKATTKAKVKSLENKALNQFKSWTAKHHLKLSGDKSNYMHFNKNRNDPRWSAGMMGR
ncbi:hypothetical protein AVEN_70126-1 [Araneus ventricosus]|uniref:Endonuclease/exonuclease/phosphatase domain-containing protein n=1 Tax=Araneus ventricosus TaxID=182803 RepID=A0A4Y2EKK6_ARAVE|nr:hypothetical protein AVEN_70126-1 [Araneus ventricosus]